MVLEVSPVLLELLDLLVTLDQLDKMVNLVPLDNPVLPV